MSEMRTTEPTEPSLTSLIILPRTVARKRTGFDRPASANGPAPLVGTMILSVYLRAEVIA